MIAMWKSPDGASSTTPPVQYAAPGRRFGAFWPLTLSPATATGTWVVEATVDGQPAGRLTFEVGSGGGGAAPSKATRQILTQPQLFARLTATFVGLERTTSKGRRLDPAAAVALGRGRTITSLAAVDGADALTAVLPDGRRQPISVLSINRARRSFGGRSGRRARSARRARPERPGRRSVFFHGGGAWRLTHPGPFHRYRPRRLAGDRSAPRRQSRHGHRHAG
jgi:hypothetical protein